MDPDLQRQMMAQQLMGAPMPMMPQMQQQPMGVRLQGMPGVPQPSGADLQRAQEQMAGPMSSLGGAPQHSPEQNAQLMKMMQGMMGPPQQQDPYASLAKPLQVPW